MDPNISLQRTVEATLAAAVAAAGTFDVTYPTGFNESHFSPVGHKIVIKNGGTLLQGDNFAISFGLTAATITLGSGEDTLAAGTTVFVEMALKGNRRDIDLTTITGLVGQAVSRRQLVEINLGAPATADVDGLLTSYTGSAPALDGALVSGGVGTFDVPRNIVVDSGGADTAVLTFTGTDVYGNTLVESITLNGSTAVGGKKAFKTVTGVSSSGAIANGAFAGPGDVLGLPVFLPNSAFILKELEDGAAATSGTTVAGSLTKATATTGDIRGTYDPNSACNGAKNFSLIVALDDPEYLGISQYAG